MVNSSPSFYRETRGIKCPRSGVSVVLVKRQQEELAVRPPSSVCPSPEDHGSITASPDLSSTGRGGATDMARSFTATFFNEFPRLLDTDNAPTLCLELLAPSLWRSLHLRPSLNQAPNRIPPSHTQQVTTLLASVETGATSQACNLRYHGTGRPTKRRDGGRP